MEAPLSCASAGTCNGDVGDADITGTDPAPAALCPPVSTALDTTDTTGTVTTPWLCHPRLQCMAGTCHVAPAALGPASLGLWGQRDPGHGDIPQPGAGHWVMGSSSQGNNTPIRDSLAPVLPTKTAAAISGCPYTEVGTDLEARR